MKTLSVLGIGSPFGDDRLGWEVVNILKQLPKISRLLPEKLSLAACDRPGMQLLELMRDTHTIFLIDAIKTGAPVGTIHMFKNQEIEAITSNFSTHALGIADAMKLGASLQELPAVVILYGVEIQDTFTQFNLSKPIMCATKRLSLKLQHDILQLVQ